MTVTIGIATPIVTRTGDAPEWIVEGTIEDVAHVVAEADRLGYDFCTCSEHVGIPDTEIGRRGATYWDPLATFGYLAARTTRIRFATWVLVLAYHHPLELAKRYGQLDRMSGDRLVLGVGVGTLREEFDALGVPFEGRGERADDTIRAIRAVWGERVPEYRSEHHDIAGLVVDPHAARTDLPIWIGGRTRRSLRRAVEVGDGWSPFALSRDEVAEMLAWARVLPSWEARDTPIDVTISITVDPLGEPDRAQRGLDAAEQAGATCVAAGIVATSRAHYVEQLGALHALTTA